VNVVREYDPDLPRIAANGSELNQIWMALLENALDAMHDSGTIRVTTQNAGDMVRVEIWDDGPGIPPELHNRIFEPFFTTKPPERRWIKPRYRQSNSESLSWIYQPGVEAWIHLLPDQNSMATGRRLLNCANAITFRPQRLARRRHDF